MRKHSFILCVLLVLALVLGACTSSNPPASSTAPAGESQAGGTTEDEGSGEPVGSTGGNIFRMALEQDIETLDSHQNTADYTAAVAEGVTEALLREHNGEFLPGMASSYETDDYITWTFTIREDACWSDGTPITAHDFEYSWKEIWHREEAAKVHGFFEGMKNTSAITAAMAEGKTGDELTAVTDTLGVTAVDDHTLVVELESARPWYITNFSSTYFAPIHRELYEANGSKYGSSKELMAYNGPFVVEDWKYNESVTMVKNPNYWNKDAVALDGVELYIVKDVEPRVNMFREGRVDFARASSEYYQTMADQVYAVEGSSWSYILTNMDRRDADGNVVNQAISDLIANRDFVNAISYSVDRTVLYGQVITDPTKFPAPYVVTGQTPLNNGNDETFAEGRARLGLESPVPLTADAELAKESLEKAMEALGYSDVSQIPTISLVVASDQDVITVCDFVRLSVEQTLGIKLEVEPVEFNVRDSRIISGDYDLLLMGWGMDYPDATSIYEVWATDLFATGWPRAEAGQYNTFLGMMEALGTSDFAARGETLMEAEMYLLENGPFITMNFSGFAGLLSDRVDNFYSRDSGARFDFTFASVQ